MMEMKGLPDYLRANVNAAPRKESIVACGDVRVTVITPCLVRIEQGAWTDDATLTVIRRDFGDVAPETERAGEETVIRTGMLEIRCRAGLPLKEGLTIRRLSAPAFLWHYGDKP
ncbi:MAG: hypothetical protein ACI4OY_07755, partial [Aristaeellaceae bacterium]